MWGVVAVALVVRVAWALIVPVDPISDSKAYDLLARNLAAGHGYAFEPGRPSAYWPVGTSALYAALYVVFGSSHTSIVVLNILIGTATVWLTTALASEGFGPRAGLVAGLLLALWPGQVEFTTVLASELPFNLAYLTALFVVTRPQLHPAVRVVLTGAALAAASYNRPIALLLPFVFAWVRLIGPGGPRPRSWRRAGPVLAEMAGMLVVMAALILPWSLRNARALGHPVPVSTNGGPNLWMGNNPSSKGDYMPLPDSVRGMDEVRRDKLLKEQAVAYIRQHPGAFVTRTLRKLVRTHERETIGVSWNVTGLERTFGSGVLTPLKFLSSAYWGTAVVLAIVGALAALRQQGMLLWLGQPAIVLWAYFGMLHAVIVAGDRYHYPCVPQIAALAGLGLVQIGMLLPNSRKATPDSND